MRFVFSFLCFFTVFLSYGQDSGQSFESGLEQMGFQTKLFADVKVKQLIKINIHNKQSVKLVAEGGNSKLIFEFFSGYDAKDFQAFKTMYYRPFLGEDVLKFDAYMLELMKQKACQKNYLPTEIHLNISRQYPALVYRSLDTTKKSWRYSCKSEDTLGVNYWGVFYQPKNERVVTFKVFFIKGHEDENELKEFLLNLKVL